LVQKYESLVSKEMQNHEDDYSSSTRQDTEALCSEIEKRCHSQKSNCDKWPQRLGRASAIVKTICSLVDTAVKVSPQASLVWAGISVVLPLMENLVAASTAQNEGFVYVCGLINYYSALSECLSRHELLAASVDRIASAMDNMSSLIVDYQVRSVIRLLQAHVKTYAKDGLLLNDWKSKLEAIRSQESELDKLIDQGCSVAAREEAARQRAALDSVMSKLTLQVSLFEDHKQIANETLQVGLEQLKHTVDTETQNCIQAFGPAEYRETKRSVKSAVPGTCGWVLDSQAYRDWLDGKNSFLFVSAGPGCGKSVLTKLIIDELAEKQSNFNVCYFFFKDGVRNSINEVFQALIHQLISRTTPLADHAKEAYHSNGRKVVTLMETMTDILISILKDAQSRDVVIILDALDECKPDQLPLLFKQMVFILEKLGSRKNSIQFLMTGRPYGLVEESVRSLQRHTKSAELSSDDHPEALSKEIGLVIELNVQEFSETHGMETAATTRLKDGLLSKVHRTYLWLYLVMDYLDAAVRNDVKLTERGIGAALGELPATVEEAYEKLLVRSPNPKMARRLLQILLAAQRVLTVGELNEAVYTEVDSSSVLDLDLESEQIFCTRIREWCGLFVSVYGGKAYFIHQTAREFLLAHTDGGVVDHSGFRRSVTMQEAHKTLFSCCASYLDFAEMRAHGQRMKRLFQVETVDLDKGNSYRKLKSRAVPPTAFEFLDYASLFWDLHLRQASDNELARSEQVIKLCDVNEVGPWVWLGGNFIKSNYKRRKIQVGGIPMLSRPHIRPDFYTYAPSNFTQLAMYSFLGLNELAASAISPSEQNHCSGLPVHGLRLFAPDEKPGYYISDNDDTRFMLAPLWAAALNGHNDTGKLLLSKGQALNDLPFYGRTLLPAIVVQSEEKLTPMLETFLQQDSDFINWTFHDGRTLLHLARGRIIPEILIKHGADVNARAINGDTPLHRAMTFEFFKDDIFETIEVLLSHGADPNVLDKDGCTPLSFATRPKIMEVLLRHGADANVRRSGRYKYPSQWNGEGLLHCCPDPEAIKLLLRYGADPHVQDEHGRTPLHCSAHHELFLPHGLDPNARDMDGKTPLHYSQRIEDMETLLRYGADSNARDNQGRTPLHFFKSKDATEILLRCGVDPNAQDNQGRTPLHYSTEEMLPRNGVDIAPWVMGDDRILYRGRWRIAHIPTTVKTLLRHGADPNVRDNDGFTPLYRYLKRHFKDGRRVERALASVKDPRWFIENPWIEKTIRYFLETVKLLLDNGADENAFEQACKTKREIAWSELIKRHLGEIAAGREGIIKFSHEQ
jgi:ankyrin repeat protein